MLRFFAGLAAVAVALAAECPTDFPATFADMHDGDQKTVAISGAAMTITPAIASPVPRFQPMHSQ